MLSCGLHLSLGFSMVRILVASCPPKSPVKSVLLFSHSVLQMSRLQGPPVSQVPSEWLRARPRPISPPCPVWSTRGSMVPAAPWGLTE